MKKRAILTTLFLLANIVTLFAQPGPLPCGDADPDGVSCPVDTWVVGFAALALIFTVIHLHRKAQTAPVLPNN